MNHLSQHEKEERERKKRERAKGKKRKEGKDKDRSQTRALNRLHQSDKKRMFVLAAQGSDAESKCGWK